MTIRATSDLWWRNGLVYCLDVETFLDADGDGCGDLQGLTERLDHLAGLGVTVLWLMPFQPSPDRDDGYDITDFYGVDPRLGTLGQFVELVRTARQRGMRVIIDLVVNHTSDRHPWFIDACSDRAARHRDWYVWADDPEPDPALAEVFPGEQGGVWTLDEGTGQHYLHRFYAHQPDLNVANAEVRDEIARIVGFWLELGVSGFRVDAVPFLLELNGIEDAPTVDPHEYLADLRAFMGRRRGDAILLGEVNLPPEDQRVYFGDEDGDELHMVFNFSVMQRIWLALARGDAAPVIEALRGLPDLPSGCQWANFLRNHDELTLDQLSDGERAECFAAFGPDEEMQVYDRGLRRRLPPMLGGDRARIELAYSLLLSLPGTPVLFYGEEVGMGENLAVSGRSAVRTPMQWTAEEPGAGFSTAPPDTYPAPITTGAFGPAAVNVADARRDRGSLLEWFERAARRRNETPEIGFGAWSVVDVEPASVLAHRCDWEGATVLAVHNFAAEPVTLRLVVDVDGATGLDDLLDGDRHAFDGPGVGVDLPAYGYRWFRVTGADQAVVP